MDLRQAPKIETLSKEQLLQLNYLEYFRSIRSEHDWNKGLVTFVALECEDQNFYKHFFSLVIDPSIAIPTKYPNTKIPEDLLVRVIKAYVKVILTNMFVEEVMVKGCPHCGYRFHTVSEIDPHFRQKHGI